MADPIRQLLSQTSYVADGSQTVWNFSFSGGYIDKSHVKAKYLDAARVEHQIAVTPGMFLGQYQLNITPPIAAGSELVIYRGTPKEGPLVDFADRAALTEQALDLNAKQAVFVAAESSDGWTTIIEATNADRLQTGEDRNAARDSAANALTSEQIAVAAHLDITSNWSDKLATAAAQATLATTNGQTQVALAAAQAVIATDKAGVATEQAGVSSTKAAEAQVLKVAAEAARDAAQLSSGIYATTAAGLAATTTGKYFSTPSPDSNEYLILYLNSAGVAVEKKRYPSAKILESFAKYTGLGPLYPLAVDSLNNTIFGFNATTGELFGLGLVVKSKVASTAAVAVTDKLGELQQAIYTGSGPVIPMVTDANNQTLLGFDVATGKWIGPGLGGASAVSGVATPAVLSDLSIKPVARAINQLLFYGQSLSIGAKGTPVISTTQPYSNITFNGGPRAAGGDYSAFKPLVEDALTAPDGGTDRGETPCSGAANYATTLRALDGLPPSGHVILASTAGLGGSRITQLNKGTSWYSTRLLPHITNAKALNADHALQAFAWVQGEQDALTGVQTHYATYRALLEQLQADIETDAKGISPLTGTVYCLTYQLSYAAATWPDQALAQLDLAQKNSKFVLVTPTYHLPHFTDNVHLTAVGYKWMGAYFGRAYKQLMDGKRPKWLNPVSATRRGAVIRVRFDVPCLPLVLDTVTLAATINHGFRVLDGATSATISSISIDGADVVITLSAVPAGAVAVRCGLDYLGAGLTITGGASTNLRDSTPDTISISGTSYQLYHVATHFQLTATTLGD